MCVRLFMVMARGDGVERLESMGIQVGMFAPVLMVRSRNVGEDYTVDGGEQNQYNFTSSGPQRRNGFLQCT